MNTVFTRLESIPKAIIAVLGVLLVAAIGWLDHATGYEITVSFFYVLPIMFVSWFGGRAMGVLLSALSAFTWLSIDYLSGHQFSSLSIALWNMLMVLGFFLLITFSLIMIRSVLDRERLLARVDHLTGALNSRAFYEAARGEIDRSVRYGHSFTLAYVDLDNFKQVNDTLGHSAGDRLLCDIAALMRTQTRASDLVARVGGDEFVLLLPETNEEQARVAIEKVQAQFGDLVEKHRWPVSFSIGVVTCKDPCTLDDLLKEADSLMYEAKAEGKDRAAFRTMAGSSAPPSGRRRPARSTT